jgi:hypothetical protein
LGVTIAATVIYLIVHHAHSKPKTDLDEQNITFTVCPDSTVHVSGDFHFYNLKQESRHLQITFPLGRANYLSPPQNPLVLARWETGPETLQVKSKKWEWRLDLPLDSADTTPLHLEYDQRTSKPKFRYILTSAKPWGLPIDSARFTIKLPRNYQLASASFDYQTSVNQDDCNVYTIFLTDFTPKRELEFTWQPVDPNLADVGR